MTPTTRSPEFFNRQAAFRARLADVEDRTYKRDRDGKFASGSGGGVREALAGAGSLRELNDAAMAEARRITGRDISFDMTGSHLDTAKEHSEGILRALERFPAARLENVRVADIGTPWAHADGTSVVFNSHYASEAGRSRYLKSLEAAAGGWDEAVPRPYYSAITSTTTRNGGTPMSVAIHEMGHIVDLATLGQRIHPEVSLYIGNATKREQRSQTLPGGPVRDSHDLIMRSVSAYAAERQTELVAEAFTDVMNNGSTASTVSRGIVGILQREYDAATATPANHSSPAFFARVEQARARQADVLDRFYKRDRDGQFSSTGGGDGGPRGIRDALAAPKTIGELETAAASEFRRILGRRVGVDLRGLDVETARAHLEGVARGAEMFPHTDLISVSTFGPGGTRSTVPGTDEKTWGATQSVAGRPGADIAFNTRIKADTLRDHTGQAYDRGLQHHDRSDITLTGSHECGHAAAASLHRGTVESHAVDQVRVHGGRLPYETIEETLSRYAGSDPGELIAEAVAQVASRGSDASPLALGIVGGMQQHWDVWKL